jgi:ectoine hydroxylase-related dioxygenase (phytanoyl-CoA dioxygenase family)
MLSEAEAEQFWRDGYLVAKSAVSAAELEAMRAEIAGWVEASRAHRAPFGPPTVDERPRFDMGAEHSATRPALRRVNNPSDISAAFGAVMERSAMVDMVAALIGPDVKFHHCKINLKLPGSHTEVGYHQDFGYTPHTNDDVVTALLMLDDMTLENGCLQVVPGSHRGPVFSLFEGERFTGFIAPAVVDELKARQVPITGSAGSVCLMHTRLAHGSDANRSDRSRGLYICVYTAADAFPLARNPMANPNEGMIVRGQKSRKARLTEALIELPEQPKLASFFAVQGQRSAAAN